MSKALSVIFIVLFFSSCGGENEIAITENPVPVDNLTADTSIQSQQNWNEKPFADIDIPFREYNYNNKTGLKFELESGTVVEIPSKAFEDKNGNPVNENITVQYREFHSINDVMIAGIKMKYNEGDTMGGDFETAGMFEIRAFNGNDELQLKKDKTIDVDLASFKSGDFSNYQMNEATNNWEFIEKKDPQSNVLKKEKLTILDEKEAVLKAVCSIEPIEYSPTVETFDLDYDLGRFNELEFVSEAMWISAGDAKEKNELKKSLSGFDDMELTPTDSCNVFKLSVWKKDGIVNVKNKKTFLVSPVWTGPSLKRVKKNYAENVKALKELTDERNVTEREADLIRSFQLKGMGVYNCDRVLDYVKFVVISLAVIFKDKIKSFFYITNNGQVAIKYYDMSFDNFRFNPNSSNSIIAILPENKVAIVTEKQFADAYQIYKSDSSPDKVLKVELKSDNIPVADKKDFDNHVARY